MDTIETASPPRDHNAPPLAELLAEEVAPLRQKAEDLVASVGRAEIVDEDTAGRAVQLIAKINGHIKRIEAARVERKAPFLESGRVVDASFNAVIALLAAFDAKSRLIGGPLKIVTDKAEAWQRKKEDAAAAERRRLEEEARRQREATEAAVRAQREAEERERQAAQRAAEAEAEARRQGDLAAAASARRKREAAEAAERQRRLDAEMEERRRRDEAARLEREAGATKAPPIAGLGASAHRRAVWRTTITDLTTAIRHARKVDEAAIRQAVQTIYDRQVRAGVRELPGATVEDVGGLVVRAG